MADEAKVKNPWEGEEGLEDDFDFWINKSSFGKRQEYQEGEVPLLIWEGESPDAETTSLIFPIGGKWEIIKGGAEVKHEKGKKGFIKTSMIGRLILATVNELKVDMSKRGEPTEAKVWEGLGFHMKRKEFVYDGILESKGGKTQHLMPVAFLGEKGAKSKTEKKAEAKSAGDESKLITMAKKLDRNKFQSLAMDMQEVVNDKDLMSRVLDDGPDGFWAKHHG